MISLRNRSRPQVNTVARTISPLVLGSLLRARGARTAFSAASGAVALAATLAVIRARDVSDQ